jgi:hypothetical protein
MNLILAGFGKILVQLSATFLVLGTAYLLLFAPNADGPLPPEQVAENLAPIGRVQIAEPAAPISTPTQTPVSTPATAAPPAATPAPIATTAAPELEAPAATGESSPVISQAPVAAATEEPIPTVVPAPTPVTGPDPDPASLQTPPAVPAPTPTASSPSPAVDGAAEASIRLAPDGNGMHGSYRLTPEGILLYPASMIGPNTAQFTTGPIIGSFWATPSGVAHFRLQPTAPVD